MSDNAGQRLIWMDPAVPVPDGCVLCGNSVGNTCSLQVDLRGARTIRAARCGSCASIYFPDLSNEFTDYPDPRELAEDPDFRIVVRHYLELVGGLDWRVGLLERLDTSSFEKVLEVGSNAGLLVDYCRINWGADAVGLEPSAYGAVGSEFLGVPVQRLVLPDDIGRLSGGPFDLVFATEVLEHCDDPIGFLSSLRQLTGEHGVLLLTTPRSDSIDPETPLGELYAALSVGAHRFLLSPVHLGQMLTDAEFMWHEIGSFGITNVAYASPSRPLDLFDVDEVAATVPYRLRSYYEARLSLDGVDRRMALADKIAFAILSRQLSFDVGPDLLQAIDIELSDLFGISIGDLPRLVRRLEQVDGLVEFGRLLPFRLPDLVLYVCVDWSASVDVIGERLGCAGLIALTGMRIDPVNMFVYRSSVVEIAHALDGRGPTPFSERFRQELGALPETRDITFMPGTPLPQPTKGWLGRSTVRRARALGRRMRGASRGFVRTVAGTPRPATRDDDPHGGTSAV